MKAILVNYNHTPDWLKDYDFEYVFFDRSDDGVERDLPNCTKTQNIGQVDYDKLGWLIDNYDNLPEVFLWGKSNLFKYITKEEFDKVKDNKTFTPLLTQNHKTYADNLGVVCYYQDGMYYERNDGWFVPQFASNFQTLNDFCHYLCVSTLPRYIPFPPGGNFILTKERVHRYGKDFYIAMQNTLIHSKLPAEAHMCERLYYTLWR